MNMMPTALPTLRASESGASHASSVGSESRSYALQPSSFSSTSTGALSSSLFPAHAALRRDDSQDLGEDEGGGEEEEQKLLKLEDLAGHQPMFPSHFDPFFQQGQQQGQGGGVPPGMAAMMAMAGPSAAMQQQLQQQHAYYTSAAVPASGGPVSAAASLAGGAWSGITSSAASSSSASSSPGRTHVHLHTHLHLHAHAEQPSPGGQPPPPLQPQQGVPGMESTNQALLRKRLGPVPEMTDDILGVFDVDADDSMVAAAVSELLAEGWEEEMSFDAAGYG
jgi:hypothetical protein